MNCDNLRRILAEDPLRGWTCRLESDFLRLETPLRYPDGGVIELFVEEQLGGFVVTDFGEAFRFLQTYGIDPLRSSTRKQSIHAAARLAGAVLDGDVLEIRVSDLADIIPASVRLGQVITRVSDLSSTATGAFGTTLTDALEDFVRAKVIGAEVRRGEVVHGRAATHRIDLLVRTPRAVSAIEALSAGSMTGANAQTAYTIQKFVDLSALGPGSPHRYAVLDDSADVWTDSLRRQLANVSDVIDWERRDKLSDQL